ncbi:NADP-dependent succinic semialdehyde dehydrogenase [Williamsia sterculiae]|uniref:Succinate-semialdehyde dehydrogenase / glutarate-semialdehyde dehydrogenase n=1 Tax=Williamsia sterculiae TaxID=1344003 RepID=A0A1N7FLC5_9NOCA|nr:NADP-dependent succinic semialdehyde dehydrogenase [Williamsia sterculiae]SIS01208.1 succinate-semialdehyde dehydrogenase / glutarate-semialdehyde dehydrogenase [Williamsia sterculiae]
MAIASINPATGELLEEFDALTDAEVESRLATAARVAVEYRGTDVAQRAHGLRSAADILDAEVDTLAGTMTAEMGKTLSASKAEIAKCAKGLRFYADHGADFLADEAADAGAVGASRAFHRYQPLGVVLAVMPWNFPLWQVIRFAAPSLMAGNVGLLKHASNVPRTALYLEDLFTRAGLPKGAFQTLLVSSSQIEAILQDSRVAAATLTGSEGAGRAVGRTAGEALKKVVLELGGSDPFVVLPSADLEKAAQTATTARCQNNGQSCIAAKRFIVHQDVYDDFIAKFVARMGEQKVGDPTDESTAVGPLATEQGRQDVIDLVDDAVAKGAEVLLGGTVPDGPGWFYPPTVIAGITEEMDLYAEEVFGPVAAVYKAADLDEAVRLANVTRFGLGSNVWTTDPDEIERCIDDFEAGQVFVNGMTTSYPELAFGGVKDSGHGRELTRHGMHEFCNLKTVWVG